jgi:hypothetical protein
MLLACENMLVGACPGAYRAQPTNLRRASALAADGVSYGGTIPTRFPTMLTSVHRRPPPSANCANAIRVNIGERSRTPMGETKTEPRPASAPSP